MVFHPGDPSDFDMEGTVRMGSACVPAALYDNQGSPAVAHGMPGLVVGTLFWLRTDTAHETMSLLDHHHRTLGPEYVRTIAMAVPTTAVPVAVAAWNWTGTLDLPEIANGDWTRRDDPKEKRS